MLSIFSCSKRRQLETSFDTEIHIDTSSGQQRNVRSRITSEVKLNVGGVQYQTTRETLRQCEYFAALLDDYSGFAPAVGELFVDRDGDLFRHILAYMRTAQRPSNEVLERHRRQLLDEVAFFGFDSFQRELEGSTNPHKLRPEDKKIWRDEEDCADLFQHNILNEIELMEQERFLLRDVFAEHRCENLTRLDPSMLMLPLLWPCKEGPFQSGGSPAAIICQDIDAFHAAYNEFLGGLLDDLGDEVTNGIVFAGGSVLHGLCGTEASDVDIFLIGTDEVAADQKLRRILAAVKKNVARHYNGELRNVKLEIVRTRLCVTAYRPKIDNNPVPAIQVILTTYRSPLEVIMNFDIDACCVLFDPGKRKVYALPRALRALRYRANVADTLFRSPTFEHRLEKYAQRGFAIVVPGLDEGALRPGFVKEKYYVTGDTRLVLRLCQQRHEINSSREIRPQGIWSNAKLLVGRHCEAEALEGLQRLIVLDRIGRGIIDGESAAEALRSAILVHPEGANLNDTYAFCSDLHYRRYNTDGTPEDLDSSDSNHALRVVRSLLSKQNDTSEAMMERRKAAPGHHPEDKMSLTIKKFSSSHAWKSWARQCCVDKKRVWLVYEKTKVTNEEHADLSYFWDLATLPEDTFHKVNGASDDEFERVVGISRRLSFLPTHSRNSCFFGRRNRGQYHKQHGDWFSQAYACEK